eukprot:8187090-Lingulodinium_polyedra.AAC.1
MHLNRAIPNPQTPTAQRRVQRRATPLPTHAREKLTRARRARAQNSRALNAHSLVSHARARDNTTAQPRTTTT